METCYKAFRTDLLKSIPIRCDRFGIEPEITMKCAKRKLRIYEVPISYHGRTYEEGKKIGWKDGIKAFAVILQFWLIDDLYVEPYGRGLLNNLTGTPQYLNWVTNILRPAVGDSVIEIGAGIGNMSGRLMGKRLSYVAAEKDPLYLHALHNRFFRTPNVSVRSLNPEIHEDYSGLEDQFETVLCLNVLEYVEDSAAVIRSMSGCLQDGGMLLVLAPQGPALFGSVDRTMGHKRRFTVEQLTEELRAAGLKTAWTHEFNRAGAVAWWFNSRVLGRKRIHKLTLKLFDKTVWLWRRVEWLFPWSGLSIVVAARKVAPGVD
jgi:2-polyprenyl-3-methyl-5-hydroxy-6-metoxy-1,4-benzoquinol methylase